MSQAKSPEFRRDIEGLRAIAIVTVVAYHCDVPWIVGGFVGVDVFFVLSGYLITRLLVAEVEGKGQLSMRGFYARRVRRLLPASALTLLVTLAIGSFLFAPGELEFAARAGRASALYLGNVFFAINAADYFAPRVELNPLVHMWSLAVEEQFYVFWPPLIAVGLLWLRSRRALVALIAGLTAASLAACIWQTGNDATTAFYLLPTRAWEFGAGGLFSLAVWRSHLSPRTSVLAGWAGLLLLALSLFSITSESAFPGWLAAVPVAGTGAILLAGATTPDLGVSSLLSTVLLRRIGALSYSWYLWHWPFLVFAQILFPGVSTSGKVVSALAALIVAAVSFHLVENPLRHHPALVRRPILSLACGAVLTAICFLSAAQARAFAETLARQPAMKSLAAAAADDGRLPRTRCVATGAALLECEFGQREASTHVVLFGDSHAIHWFNPIQSIAERRHWRVTTVLKSGCGAADLEGDTQNRDNSRSSCVAWRKQAIESIIKERPDLVILGTATNRTSIERNVWRERVLGGTHATLLPLTASGLRVAVMRDVPRFAFDVPDCLARAARHRWDARMWCRGTMKSTVNPDVYTAEQEAAKGLKGVGFVDTLSALCDRETCETMSGGQVMYRDDNHMTGTFADTLRPLVEQQLAVIFGEAQFRGQPAGRTPAGEESRPSVR